MAIYHYVILVRNALFQCSNKNRLLGTFLGLGRPKGPASTFLDGRLALAGGLYVGLEKFIRTVFAFQFPDSIRETKVGFMTPALKLPTKGPRRRPRQRHLRPTYQQVHTEKTGHMEVVYIDMRRPQDHFEHLMRFFFQIHDPTTKNRQGNDVGFQFASWIFCSCRAQANIALRVRDELQTAIDQGIVTCYENRRVATNITRYTRFKRGPSEHQQYLMKYPSLTGYNQKIYFGRWPQVQHIQPARKQIIIPEKVVSDYYTPFSDYEDEDEEKEKEDRGKRRKKRRAKPRFGWKAYFVRKKRQLKKKIRRDKMKREEARRQRKVEKRNRHEKMLQEHRRAKEERWNSSASDGSNQ
jgi:peptide-methionine (S)-S-oxide reductase